MDVINPATEEVLAVCPRASEAQLDAAVAAGKAAFPAWAHTPIAERRAMLLKLADALSARIDEFARLLTLNIAAPQALIAAFDRMLRASKDARVVALTTTAKACIAMPVQKIWMMSKCRK